MRPEVLLLDCGGTITWPPFDRLAAIVREVKGIDLPVEAQYRAFHRGSHALEEWQRTHHSLPVATPLELGVWIFNAGLATEGFDGVWDLPCAELMVERGERLGNWDYTFPWVKPCLDRLKRAGYRMALVSNADGQVEEMLNRLGYAPYFEAIIDSTVVEVSKPDPQIFYIALKALRLKEYVLMAKAAADGQGVRPPVLFAGDNYTNDFLGATKAGLHACLLDPLEQYGSWGVRSVTDIRVLTAELA